MTTRRRPSRFGSRGRRLWDAHHDQVAGERGLVLLEEACRIADRLDKLDRLLQGEADVWCRLAEDRDGTIEVVLNAPLVEARQQANVLRQIIAALPLEEAQRGSGDGDWTASMSPPVRHAARPELPHPGPGHSGGVAAAP